MLKDSESPQSESPRSLGEERRRKGLRCGWRLQPIKSFWLLSHMDEILPELLPSWLHMPTCLTSNSDLDVKG